MSSKAQLNSHKTAIGRTKPSAPSRYLSERGLILGQVLDYGCGRGFDAKHYGFDSYDPHYQPKHPTGKYDTVLCSYVLNTLERHDQLIVIGCVNQLLKMNGVAYFTVRRNVKKVGYTSKDTYQENTVLPFEIMFESSDHCIYKMVNQLA